MTKTKKQSEISWTASEYIEHKRGVSWYLLLLVVTAALAGLVYLFTHDIFGTIITVVLGIIVGSTAHWKPQQINYRLTDKGFHAGEKFYPYSQFKAFSVVREGQLESLAFHPVKRFATLTTAFIDTEDEEAMIALIGDHLPMVDKMPDGVDRLSRRLRF